MSDENNVAENTAGSVVGTGAEELVKVHLNIPSPTVFMVENSFHFKKDDLGNKRPTLKLSYPVPTLEGVIKALEDDKQRQYVLDILAAEVYKAVRSQLTNDDGAPAVNTQEELDLSKLTLEYLANVPAAERRGGGISKETWEAFGKDYLAVMPAVQGKTAEQVSNAVKIFLAKFQPIKTNKQILKVMREYLALWASNTQNLEEFADCYEFLDKKVETLLAADETALLANL